MFFNPGIEKWVNSKIKPCHNMLTPDEKKEKPEKDNLIQYEMLSKKVVPPSAVDGDSEGEKSHVFQRLAHIITVYFNCFLMNEYCY